MKRNLLAQCVALLAAGSLHAADGDLIAESDAPAAFAVYTSSNATYAVTTAAELSALPLAMWLAGETVTAEKWDGTVSTVVSSAAAAGSMSLARSEGGPVGAGGMWTLHNSSQGTARVGVSWSVFGDSAALAHGAAADQYAVDSRLDGPDRRTNTSDAMPVAYSGDSWSGDAASASSLKFVSPSSVTNAYDLAGTGTVPFRYGETGLWRILLSMANGTELESNLYVSGGFVISFR